MANRAWRNELNNRNNYMFGNAYGNQMGGYQDRRNFGGRGGGGFRDDKRGGKREYPGRMDGGTSPKRSRDNMQGGPRRSFGSNADTMTAQKKTPVKYNVRVPKVTLDLKESSFSVLKGRYPKLYIPSDFFHSDFRWQEVFPLNSAMKLGNKADFHVFSREIDPLTPFTSDSEPVDANYIYSAKVMLLNTPDYKDLVSAVSEKGHEKPLNKVVHFLVGNKGKNETMAIGGPWSPSLDGANPDEDPQVLINTAIRTCKQLTGIDLTPCKEWHRFLEFHYYRPAERQGLNVSAETGEKVAESEQNFRVETVVIFIPSVWDCVPDETAWEELKNSYAAALDAIINPPIPEPNVEILESEDKKEEEEKVPDETVEKPAEEKMEVETSNTEEKKVETTSDVKPVEHPVEKPKEISDKEKKRLERLYKLPDKPSLLVHSNKAAKNGKFECQLMSLDSLLDYRTEDQKEYTFEVSVFAEQFQEMILRDSSFVIYKTLLNIPADHGKADAKKDDTTKSSESSVSQELLLSFCAFDHDNAGFIKEYDLEDIIYCIGLDLSKSQVKKLAAKGCGHAGLHYKELNITSEQLEAMDSIKLIKGNKTKLTLIDQSAFYLDTSENTGTKVNKLNSEIKAIEKTFNENKSELETIRKLYHTAKDTENSLRGELKLLEGQLYNERKNVREATQVQDIYSSLLKMSRDVLERAKSKIDRQIGKDEEQKEVAKHDAVVINGTE